MLLIVEHLFFAAAICFGNGETHTFGNLVGIEDHLTVQVTGGTACCLGQGAVVAQETLLIGIDYGYQRHFGQV